MIKIKVKGAPIAAKLIKRLEEEIEPRGIVARKKVASDRISEKEKSSLKQELRLLEEERNDIREFLHKYHPEIYGKYMQLKSNAQIERERKETWERNKPLFPGGKFFIDK